MVMPLEINNDDSSSSTKMHTYPLHSLLSAMKGLEIANETVISMSENGMMAIQHQTVDPIGTGCSNFVDFIMTCLEDEEDEEETD